jgi:hypothetical protein
MPLEHGAGVNEQLWENEHMYSSKHRAKLKKQSGLVIGMGDSAGREMNWSHETPLHFSVLFLRVEATVWFVKHGADASIEDTRGWSARDMAIKISDAGVLKAPGAAASNQA